MIENEKNASCKCPKKCERHGRCKECVIHHEKIKTKPNCKRKVE
jgi:hypothetical protein